MAKNDPTNEFSLYIVDDGEVAQVSNQMHMQILAALKDGPKTSAELQAITGKASSTLFVHMESLVEMNLVSAEVSEDDSRKKVYVLHARHLLSSKPRDPEVLETAMDFMNGMFDKEDWAESMVRAVLLTLDASGLDTSPMMEGLGNGVGHAMYPKMESHKMEDVMSYVKDMYDRVGLGELSVYTFMPLTVILRDSLSIPGMPHTPKYMFTMGLICTLLSESSGRRCKVVSHEIFGQDGSLLKFVVEPIM
jgi:predicted hydrocarbon binding protein